MLVARHDPLVAQHGRPLRGEIIGIAVAGQQLVDPMGPLVRIAIGQESLRFRSAVGSRPAISIDVRRTNVASSHTGDGGIPSVVNCLNTASSMKFFAGGNCVDRRTQRQRRPKHRHLPLIAGHDRHRARQIACLVTKPVELTSAISVSFGSNFVISVTSSTEPSE